MKTEIFNVTPRPGMVKATKENCAELGRPFTGIILKLGQVILLPKTGVADPRIEPVGPTKSNKMAVLNVNIDGKGLWLPLGSLNKIPYGKYGEEFKDKFEVNRELYEIDNHWDRAEFLANKADEGKALRVKEIYASQRVALVRNEETGKMVAGKNPDNSIATQPADFCVFEWVDAPAE